jgi:hypothetical protein
MKGRRLRLARRGRRKGGLGEFWRMVKLRGEEGELKIEGNRLDLILKDSTCC